MTDMVKSIIEFVRPRSSGKNASKEHELQEKLVKIQQARRDARKANKSDDSGKFTELMAEQEKLINLLRDDFPTLSSELARMHR